MSESLLGSDEDEEGFVNDVLGKRRLKLLGTVYRGIARI